MSDWTDRLAGDGPGEGVTQPAQAGAGRAVDGNPSPPPPRTAPLPGMPSSTAAGRMDVVAGRVDAVRRASGHRRRAGGSGGPERGGRAPGRRPTRRRRGVRLAILTVAALLVSPVGAYVWADTELDQGVDLGTLRDRAPSGRGTNYLIVGSDSREGLSEQARKNLRTGSTEGRRTDSMILLHTGAGGTTMMSLPRDSWVTIPSFLRPETGRRYPDQPNKLNAAFSLGGPDLLVRTVERNTGLHIDHYTEIGLAGFVDIVDAVGGVDMCLDRAIKDKNSGANLQKGCQTLNGAQALAFVRQRKQEAEGDLGRTRNQQKFLAALARKTATPGTLLDPSKVFPTVGAGLDTLIVDKDTGLQELTSLFQAMRKVTGGSGRQVNVPVSDPAFATSKGVAVKWDMRRARQLFAQLREDRPVSAR
ncbi:LCP family protein [Streptomyces phyllanthi]|uniref:LytR family transcriptional regulator n=1 Tax=Streptomyces phyllanthi TaxID=1803180 RepID=A0A5N8VXQ4_9ACTN|nr:LCP family protein [Streptomyces phyllanthi]MPY40051.1 LytR family transcriptional regulator [Streptomyces phyllanthi]